MTTFDYTSRDYFAIKADLLARAEVVLPEWTSRDASDFGMLFVDLWAYMGDILHYYVDRAAQEAFLATATQRESLLAFASLLDYIPAGRSAATATIYLNAAESLATDAAPILIPKNTRFLANANLDTADRVVFTSNTAIAFNETGTSVPGYVTYPKSTSSVALRLTEGELFTEEFTSNGQLNQQFTLAVTGVVASSLDVTVAEGIGGADVQYSLIDRLVEATNTETVYVFGFSADDYSAIGFGNGVHGKIPTTNAVVTINYRRSRGAAGNVVVNAITAFESLSNDLGPSYDGVDVIPNTVRAIGGSNSESIASLQVNIPASFRSQDRAVSIQDYTDLTLRVPSVIKAKAVVVDGAVAKTGIITYKSLSASVADLTTDGAHGLDVGEVVAIFDVDDTFDGTYIVKTGSGGTSLLYDLASASVASASVSSSATYRNAQVKVYALESEATYDGTATPPTTSPLYLDSGLRDYIYDYLEPRQMVGVNVVVMPTVELATVDIDLTLNVLPNYVQVAVEDAVKAAVLAVFGFDTVTFGQTMSLGHIYRTILDVAGVDYVTVNRFTTDDTVGNIIDTIGLTPVVKGVKATSEQLLLLDTLTVTSSGGIV